MRFATRVNRRLVWILVIGAIISCAPALELLTAGANRIPRWLALLPFIVWPPILLRSVPQYYEVRADGLYLRQGWRKVLIPYSKLAGIQPAPEAHNVSVFSTDPLLVLTTEGKRYFIAVAEERRFMAVIAGRCPQLEQTGLGLGMPLVHAD